MKGTTNKYGTMSYLVLKWDRWRVKFCTTWENHLSSLMLAFLYHTLAIEKLISFWKSLGLNRALIHITNLYNVWPFLTFCSAQTLIWWGLVKASNNCNRVFKQLHILSIRSVPKMWMCPQGNGSASIVGKCQVFSWCYQKNLLPCNQPGPVPTAPSFLLRT